MKMKMPLMLPLALAGAMIPLSVIGKKEVASEQVAKVKAALPVEAPATPKAKRKVLVFSVTNGFHHRSIPTGQAALLMMGKATDAYEPVVSNDLANFEKETLATFDAVCFLNTTGNVFHPGKGDWQKMSADERKQADAKAAALLENLTDFVKGGGGFMGVHSATDTLKSQPAYREMINGVFAGHPWGAGTPVSIKVEPGQESHPVVAMLEGRNLEFKEEIYQLGDPYDSSKVRMLLRLDTERSPMDVRGIKRKDNDFGVAWIREWGEGRVFYCSLGHNDHIYQNPTVLQHYLAGLQWVMGDLEAPAK